MDNIDLVKVAREDTALRDLLAKDPAIWFFLNLLMSSIGKTNEHLEQLHDDLEKVILKLETINETSEAMTYSLGKLPGFDLLHEDLKTVMVNQEATLFAIGDNRRD